jgi:hypothetical protein
MGLVAILNMHNHVIICYIFSKWIINHVHNFVEMKHETGKTKFYQHF